MKEIANIISVSVMLAAHASVAAEASADLKVLCYGDSITRKGEWVATVGAHKYFATINAGRSGRKAAQAKKQLAPYLKKYQNLDKIIMILGVNDLPARDKRPGDEKVDICTTGMSEAIDLALQYVKPQDIVLIAPCNVNPDTLSSINIEKGFQVTPPLLKKLEESYKALAERKGIRFASLLNVVSKENYKDGLHPNSAGDAEIAEFILKLLAKIRNEAQTEQASRSDEKG